MILVSFFSEDNVLSDEIKICYIFEFKSNENQAFRFFFFFFWGGGGGTPGIMCNFVWPPECHSACYLSTRLGPAFWM